MSIKQGTELRLITHTYQNTDRIVINQSGLVYQLTKGGQLKEGEVVYERLGVVKKVETEVESDADEPITVGYTWGRESWTCTVLALADDMAWVCYKHGEIKREYQTMRVHGIPRRKTTRKITKLEIVNEQSLKPETVA